MNSTELIRRLQKHRMWVNRNLLAAAGGLTPEQLQRAFPIGQGSIWKSLLHLWAAEYVWLEALQGNENALAPGDARGKLPGNQLGEGAMQTVSELQAKWLNLDADWEAYLARLTAESLDETVHRLPSSGGERYGIRRADVLLHVATHAQYTTAQVINMFRQVGVTKLPEVMLMIMARQEGV